MAAAWVAPAVIWMVATWVVKVATQGAMADPEASEAGWEGRMDRQIIPEMEIHFQMPDHSS